MAQQILRVSCGIYERSRPVLEPLAVRHREALQEKLMKLDHAVNAAQHCVKFHMYKTPWGRRDL